MIRIVDKDIKLKAEIDDYMSSIFTRRFYEAGNFELHINANKVGVESLIKGNLIIINNNPNKIGIIETVEKSYDVNGIETIKVYGETLKGKLKDRIIIPPGDEIWDRAIGKQETIMKHFVNNNAVNPENKDRKIEGLEIAEDKGRGEKDAWRANQNNNLRDMVEEIGKHSKLGWDILADFKEGKLVFDVMEGTDRTVHFPRLEKLRKLVGDDTESFNRIIKGAGQVVFSLEFDNINEKNFLTTKKDHKSVIYAASRGEPEDRMILQEGDSVGWDRKEAFIETNEEEIEIVKQRAKQEKEALKIINNFTVSIDPNKPFKFDKDYFLGDYITVIDEDWDVIGDYQIIEVTEISEVSGERVEVVLGDPIRTILDDIEELKKSNKGR